MVFAGESLVGFGKTGMTVSEIAGGFTVSSKLGGKSGLKNFYKNFKPKVHAYKKREINGY